ncbi:MAG: acyl-CoA/acyl-ACP dehydrogenase [Hyphomicrobiales bacterium]|nr:acyl-CoA/acyl-ACP dehydrogenase [Hyphomicrobiales bacterium]
MIDPVEALNSDKIQELHKIAIEEFRPRAAAYEANADMPEANIQTLFEKGWLTTTLPKEMGGMGSNLDTDDPATYLQAIRVVARGCPGTAHCCQVHNHTAWTMMQIASEDQIERFVKPMFTRPFLAAFVGSEAKRRHMYMMNTTATPTDGGYIVHGEKNYATNGPMMGFAIIFTAIAGVENYLDNHLMVLITPDMEGVSLDNSWYRPSGMRIASSPVITLDNVMIEQKNVLGGPGTYPKMRLQGKFHLGFAANYLGATEGMYDWYLDYVSKRGKGKDGIIQMRTGEMKIALKAAESLFHDAIRAWKTKDVVEAELLSIAAKSMAAHVGFEISHKIIHNSGSTALFDEFPLNRYIRDLETHVLHAGHDRSAQIIGQAEFGETFDSTLQR